jgi:putative peptidoglycan lipid II flippase
MTLSAGWRDPEVRLVLSKVGPTLAFTALETVPIVAMLVLANRVAGGVVVFQLALNFFYLPLALVAWPLARALLPRLTRLRDATKAHLFADEFAGALSLASFVTIPIAVAYLTLGLPIARAIAFGNLANADGVRLTAFALTALGAGIVAETWFILGTYRAYSVGDVRSPVRSMVVRVAVSLLCMLPCLVIHGAVVLPVLGASLTLGSVAGVVHMSARFGETLSLIRGRLLRSTLRTLLAAVVMAGPALAATLAVRKVSQGHLASVVGLGVGALVGLVTYLTMQTLLRSPEVAQLRAATQRLRPAGRGVEAS